MSDNLSQFRTMPVFSFCLKHDCVNKVGTCSEINRSCGYRNVLLLILLAKNLYIYIPLFLTLQ